MGQPLHREEIVVFFLSSPASGGICILASFYLLPLSLLFAKGMLRLMALG